VAAARTSKSGTGRAPAAKKRRANRQRGSLDIVVGSVFRPLKTSESVARHLVRDIVSAHRHRGDPLAGEAEMLQQYGVSRESLREALRLLEVQGLISIKRGPGGGPVVGAVDPGNLGRISTLYYFLAGATYAELFATWIDAEVRIAQLAAGNPDRDAVGRAMAPFIDGTGSAPVESVDEFVASHSAFHAVLGSLIGNKVMQLSLMAIGQIVTHHVVVNADPRGARAAIEHDHHRIAIAVAAGQVEETGKLTADHVRAVVEFFGTQIGDQMDDYVEWR
jgi:GntR family transcriptional regulator, transcriptional repressor for pyruvate dehydrogenase complex